MNRSAATASTACLLAFSAVAQTPTIHYAVPGAVAAGKATQVTFVGENLGSAIELWTSFPAKSVLKSNETGRATFEVVAGNDVPPGIGAVRLIATNGISSLHLFLIDDLPSIAERASNKTVAAAQTVKLPVAVDAACEEVSFDYYKFSARKGQKVSVEVVAQRLGSRADPVIRLLDANGRELAYCDDDPGIGRDARLQFKAPAAGEFFVEVRDMSYQGGTPYRYRLRLGDFPLASCPFPLAAAEGMKTRFKILSGNGDDLKPIALCLPTEATRVSVATKYPQGLSSGFLSVFSSELPDVLENEPNDTTNSAQKVTLPAAINGRFEKDKDRDLFEFEAKADERLIFRARTRSLGSPCDVFMELQKADGSKMTQANVTGADEGSITNTFKEAGIYRLLVEELNRRGAPNLAYRVEIEPFQPGFALSLEQEKIHGTNDGNIEIRIAAARYDYDGPIKLSLEGLGDDPAIDSAVIEEKKTNTTLRARIPANLEPGHMVHLKIVGRAKIGARDVAVRASTLPALRALFPNLNYPPAELDGLLALGVLPPGSKPVEEKPRRRRN